MARRTRSMFPPAPRRQAGPQLAVMPSLIGWAEKNGVPIVRRGVSDEAGGMLEDERAWCIDERHERLATDFVSKNWRRFSPLTRDEQVSICLEKLVWILAGRFDCRKARISTLCYGVAFERALLSRLKVERRRVMCQLPEKYDRADTSKSQVEMLEASELIRKHLRKLAPRKRQMLRMRYGIDYPEITILEIAILERLSVERARQMIRAAEKELRALVEADGACQEETK